MMPARINSFMLLVVCSWNWVLGFPYPSFSSRSVPGRLRESSNQDSFREFLPGYLRMAKDLPLQKQPYQYILPEYEPVYQEGYLSRRPEISPETIAALLPYLYESEPDAAADYASSSYDYKASPYTDDEGTWYDDSAAAAVDPVQDYESSRDRNNQEAALLQLFLDHLAGKYSLEDLETLERQAELEDDTEDQLQSLVPISAYKKWNLNDSPVLGGVRAPLGKVMTYPQLRGQKEEPLVVPASSPRKPVFTRTPMTLQKSVEKVARASERSSTTTTTTTTTPTPKVTTTEEAGSRDEAELRRLSTAGSEATSAAVKPADQSSTMEPSIKSAYEAFMAYLDQERYLRKTADEARENSSSSSRSRSRRSGGHSQRKRFVATDTEGTLTQQLANLKKKKTVA